MKAITLSSSLCLLAGYGSAIELVQPRGIPSVLAVHIQKTLTEPFEANGLSRRQSGTVSTPAINKNTLGTTYNANITVGTPPQAIAVQIDTGSSDLWMNTPGSKYCSGTGNCNDGTYNVNASSTAQYIDSSLNATYGDNSKVLGDFVNDVISFGGQSFNTQMGAAYISNTISIWGIGYPSDEGGFHTYSNGSTYKNQYPNTAFAMVQQGLIGSTAYSLYLNDLNSSSGTILFGGVDTAKYSGQLTTVPITPDSAGNYTRLMVNLTQAYVTTSNMTAITTAPVTSSDLPMAVVLDSGSSYCQLPPSMTQPIYQAFNVTWNGNNAICDCRLGNSNATIEWVFGSGAVINSPIREFVISAGQSQCIFAIKQVSSVSIAPGPVLPAILGDSFMRSAYLVYDMENNQIAIAQTIFNVSTSNIMEISNGTTGIPNAVIATATASIAVQTTISPSFLPPLSATTSLQVRLGTVFMTCVAGVALYFSL
ncbi:hypothetical protein MMC17_009144 [Xylographa soralifera]|nr:hypothetical protein [Xylographa soralifera]